MARTPIDIIGFPMDLGTNQRGVGMGPSALRIAGLEEKLKSLGYRVTDRGDVPIKMRENLEPEDPRLKYATEIVRVSGMLAAKVERSLNQRHLPLCIGGDHSLAIGSIAGVAAYCRKNQTPLVVIWLDAHTDMNDQHTTPSGNIHGMSMALSLGRGDPRLTHLLGFAPKIEPQNCAMIGIRSIDAKEKEVLKQLNLTVFTMTDIDRMGISGVINDVLARLVKPEAHVHVSFDIDCVDPSVATGVGTPVAGGLTFRETHFVMESLAECGCMASLDIAEVNPILDHKNQSAEFAAELVASIMGKRIL